MEYSPTVTNNINLCSLLLGYVWLCPIPYHLYNLKNVKNTYGEVFSFTKITNLRVESWHDSFQINFFALERHSGTQTSKNRKIKFSFAINVTWFISKTFLLRNKKEGAVWISLGDYWSIYMGDNEILTFLELKQIY